MRLVTVKTLWGCCDFARPDTWGELFQRIAKAGFGGIEVPILFVEKHLPQFKTLMQENKLALVAQIHTAGYTPTRNSIVGSCDVATHVSSFRSQLELAKAAGAVHANSHSGYDCWTSAEADRYLSAVLAAEREIGVTTSHETHRRRLLYTPMQAQELLQRHPTLKVTADLSHWACVSERLFDETVDTWWPALLATLAERTPLIHARVGYAQGPQVPHPAAPEYDLELATFEAWWTAILRGQHAAGAEVVYVEPEFGPAPYQQCLPFTRSPTADSVWEINEWIHQRMLALFKSHPEWH